MMIRTLSITLLLALILTACDDGKSQNTTDTLGTDIAGTDTAGTDTAGTDTTQAASSSTCVAIRGNGELIFSHFAGLARIMEHYGLVAGAAGGSSASITMFFLEAALENPAVYDCGGGTPCSDEESAARAALLMKSLQAYVTVLADTDEAKAFTQLLPLIAAVRSEGIDGLLNTDLSAAKDAFVDILNSQDLADLVNGEVLDLLANSPDILFHAEDLINSLLNFGSFDASDPSIFVRPGMLDFSELARKLGRIANFLAAVGPADRAGLETFFSACATPGRGMGWPAVAALDAGAGETCESRLVALASTYRTELLLVEDQVVGRVDQNVGSGRIPILVSTSVLEGDAVTAWKAARDLYNNAQPYTLDVSFDDVFFGYWGPQAVLDTVASNPRGFTDAKTARFRALGEATWGEALSFSPAEPGLARALEINSTQVSAGGWSDLHPVLVLENAGCERVVYLTRKGEESGFARGVAGLLGMGAAEDMALYDLASESAYTLSLREANGVWCTDWNAFAGTDVVEISDNAFSAPFETTDPAFTDNATAYPNVVATTGAPGCTPGVTP